MTRKEHLEFCVICQNKSFDPKYGVTCKLTGKIADFENNCENFKVNEREAINNIRNKEYLKNEENKPLKYGRIALFILGGAYLFLGILETFFIEIHHIIFGIVYWIIALSFIGFGIWSFKKPFLSFVFGLTLYVLLIILLALIEPLSILSGLSWKVLIISFLIYAINASKNQKSLIKKVQEDLLDN